MSREWDKEFITELGQILEAAGANVTADVIEGDDTLMIEPDGESFPVGCTVNIVHPTEDSTGVFLLFPLFKELVRKVCDDLYALMRYMNKYLQVGSFAVSAQDGYFCFRHTFIVDDDTDRALLIAMTADTLDIAAATAAMGADIAAPVIEGTTPVSELLNNDAVIIQQ